MNFTHMCTSIIRVVNAACVHVYFCVCTIASLLSHFSVAPASHLAHAAWAYVRMFACTRRTSSVPSYVREAALACTPVAACAELVCRSPKIRSKLLKYYAANKHTYTHTPPVTPLAWHARTHARSVRHKENRRIHGIQTAHSKSTPPLRRSQPPIGQLASQPASQSSSHHQHCQHQTTPAPFRAHGTVASRTMRCAFFRRVYNTH